MATADKQRKTTARAESADAGLTAEEKAAMRETMRERKAAARRDPASARAEGEADVRAKIAEMPESDRAMAGRIHEIVTETAPDLVPRTWYGMPAYANAAGKVICFFQSADKFKARYASLGFSDDARIDEGTMWPTSWALTELTPASERKIAELVKRAIS